MGQNGRSEGMAKRRCWPHIRLKLPGRLRLHLGVKSTSLTWRHIFELQVCQQASDERDILADVHVLKIEGHHTKELARLLAECDGGSLDIVESSGYCGSRQTCGP